MAEKYSEDLKIHIILEGVSNNGHHIPLSEFLNIAGSCHSLLKQTAQSVLKKGEYEILVSNLAHSSPVHVEITLNSNVSNAGRQMVSVLSEQVEKIHSGNTDSLKNELLEAWKKVTQYNKKKVSMFRMESVGESQNNMIFESNAYLENAVSRALAKEKIICHTSIIGRVDSVDLHKLEKGMLRAYTDVPQWDAVPVNFDYKFKHDVIKAIEKVVRIYGEARYQFGKAMPISMDMDRIEILTESSLRLADLEGVAPNITDGRSIQEYLDGLRRGLK